jgi:hypothetical protein
MRERRIAGITIQGLTAALGIAGAVWIAAFLAYAAIENVRNDRPRVTPVDAAATAVDFMAKMWPGQRMNVFETRASPLASNGGWKVEFRNLQTGSWGDFYVQVDSDGGCEYVSTYICKLRAR